MHQTYSRAANVCIWHNTIRDEDAAEIAPVLGQATVPVSEVRDCRRPIVWVGALGPRG